MGYHLTQFVTLNWKLFYSSSFHIFWPLGGAVLKLCRYSQIMVIITHTMFDLSPLKCCGDCPLLSILACSSKNLLAHYVRKVWLLNLNSTTFYQHSVKTIWLKFPENWSNSLGGIKKEAGFSKIKNVAFARLYGSKVISIDINGNLSCWWRYRVWVCVWDSNFAMVSVETVLYLCAKFNHFPASGSVGTSRAAETNGHRKFLAPRKGRSFTIERLFNMQIFRLAVRPRLKQNNHRSAHLLTNSKH